MPGGDDQDVQLLENWKCTGCRELPEGKVFQCFDGHILCDQCFSVSRPCPVCGEPIPREIRNTALEELLDRLELECEHKWNGCEDKFARKEIKTHVETCIFRQLVPLCSQMGLNCHFQMPRNNVQAVIDHFRENHQCQEAPIGTPISLILQDFQRATSSHLSSTKFIWPPLLIKSTMGSALPLVSVLLVTTNHPSDNSLSVVAIDLTDFYPGPPDTPVKANFYINSTSGRVSNHSWDVTPSPSMNCKELVPNNLVRPTIPSLATHYMGTNGSLQIKVAITSCPSVLDLDAASPSIFSIPVECIPPPGGAQQHQVGGDGDELIQQLLSETNRASECPSGRGGRGNHGRGGTRRGRRSRGRGNVTVADSLQQQQRPSVSGSSGLGSS